MSEIPSHWAQVSLSELGGLIGGKTPSKSVSAYWTNGTIPWTSPKDMKSFLIKVTEDYIATKAMHEAGMQVLPVDSVLMVTRSGILAHTFPIAIAAVPTTINQDIKALRPSDVFIPRYIAYALRNAEQQILSSCSKAGTTVASVETDLLERFPLPLTPLNEQKRIADKLDAVIARVDACRERLDRVPAILKRFRQSVLASATSGKLTEEWRGDIRGCVLHQLPVGWSLPKIGDIGRTQLGRQRAPKFHSGTNMRPYLRVQNVFEDRLDLSDVMEMEFAASDFEKYKLHPGDILLNEGQSPELLGRPAMFRGELSDVCFTNTLIRFQAHSGVKPEYALLVFRHYMHSGRFRSEGNITTNIAHLGAGRFASVEFPLPPLDEQAEIVRRVESLFAFADRFEARYTAARARVERLTQALLAKAFRGELVSQDPSDEPAAVLLERIRAAREATPAKSRQRKGNSQPSKTQKAEVTMLNRKDIQDTLSR